MLVIAVIIGIGSTMFSTLRTALDPNDMTIEQAFAVVLGSMTLMGLAIFCPRIAAGLVSGAPQLSAGAAVGTALGVTAARAAATMAGTAALRTAGGAAAGPPAVRRPRRAASDRRPLSARFALALPVPQQRLNAAVGHGAAAVGGARPGCSGVAGHFRARSTSGARAVTGASGAATTAPGPAGAATSSSSGQPARAKRFRRAQQMREGVLMAAHTIGAGDGGGASEGPNLKSRE